MPSPLNTRVLIRDGALWSLSDMSMVRGWICSGLAGIEGLPLQRCSTVPLLDGTAIPSTHTRRDLLRMGILVAPPANSVNEDNDYYAKILTR